MLFKNVILKKPGSVCILETIYLQIKLQKIHKNFAIGTKSSYFLSRKKDVQDNQEKKYKF